MDRKERIPFRVTGSGFRDTWENALSDALRIYKEELYTYTRPLVYLREASFPGEIISITAGASYKSLAYIGHLTGLSGIERMWFYDAAERANLSQDHASQMIETILEGKRGVEELEKELCSAFDVH